MVHVKIVLDTRRKKADGTFSIIYRITDVKKVYTISSGISIQESEWDETKREVVKNHTNALTINTALSKKYYLIQNGILKLEDTGRFSFEELKIQISDKWGLFQKWPHLSLQSVHSISLKSVQTADFKPF